MFTISLNLFVPDHGGAPANYIYELPDNIGVRHDTGNVLRLCSANGLSLPYVTLNGCYADEWEITKVYVEALGGIQCLSDNYANFMTVAGNEPFEILGASEALPGMSPIGGTGVFANPNRVYRARIENGCIALLKRDLLSNGFRFKAMDMWYGIVNDVTTVSEQPTQQFHQDRVYGFVIDGNNSLYPVNEAGTIY